MIRLCTQLLSHGYEQQKRTASITLVASADGDRQYKECVQELSFSIPYPLTEGRRQHILFPGIENVSADAKSVPLRATSDCGLPVYYYVKEGPAEVEGNELVLKKIPPVASSVESDGGGLAIRAVWKGADCRAGGTDILYSTLNFNKMI